MESAAEKARRFIEQDQRFRLGDLPTEQPHPRTVGLAEALARNLPAGISMLLSVDRDIPPAARRVFACESFTRLVEALTRAIGRKQRIFLTGCGATGRLSILLEAAWRRFWRGWARRRPEHASGAAGLEELVVSVMAGGDFALIRSVEGFEDYEAFGRHQLDQAGVKSGDVVVAITEGGETPFVIGTAWRGLEAGAEVFFVYNNPTDVLARHVRRSREVIEEARITKLDLHSGPMAVTGSTRMQATTAELLVVGAALELALAEQVGGLLPAKTRDKPETFRRHPDEYLEPFDSLLEQLSSPACVTAMAEMVRWEEEVYRRGGLVTYFADDYLLDILTDTTERSPTFALPPFRRHGDDSAPPSWAFVKDPLHPTAEAWETLLGRPPRGLGWDQTVYQQLDAPPPLQANPPRIDRGEILRFRIGSEEDPSRYEVTPNLAALIRVGRGDCPSAGACGIADAFARLARPFEERLVLYLGPDDPPAGLPEERCHVRCDWPASPLDLWGHLAVKLMWNTISTVVMGRLGRLVSNWMVFVQPSNKKLIDRGTRLIARLTGMDYEQACQALFETAEMMRFQPGGGVGRSPVALTIQRLLPPDLGAQ